MMLVSVLQATAQFGGFDPVSMEEVVTIKGNEGTIEFEAYIDNGYHLYSTNVPKGGPMPLSVKYLKVAHPAAGGLRASRVCCPGN